jgi:RNA-directed DNA polymerase
VPSAVLAALEQRIAEAGLQLHPDKTKIVYCRDRQRRQPYDGPCSFTIPGYTFRARKAPAWDGTSMFAAFLPAVSTDALKKMSAEVRSWRIHLRTTADLAELARWINPVVRGWSGRDGNSSGSGHASGSADGGTG